jgi:DNA polymerase I-like protein with 3'-5' exonuclease and polymerase domains
MSVNRRAALESYFMDALLDLSQPGDIALDIETYYPDCEINQKTGERKPAAIKTITDRFRSKIRLLQLYRKDGDQVWLLDFKAREEEGLFNDRYLKPLRDLLGSGDRKIVGHRIATFDALWLWHHARIRFTRIADTYIAHRLIMGGLNPKTHPEAEGGLDVVKKHYLQIEYPSDQSASDWGVKKLSREQIEYAELDVLHQHELLAEQERVIRAENLLKAWELEQRLAPVCVDMCNRGTPFDRDGALAALQLIRPKTNEARQKVREWFGLPRLNPNSHDQLKEALKARGINPPDLQAATLVFEAEKLIREGKMEEVEGLGLLADYFQVRDKEDKFVLSVINSTREDGRIHATFNQVGTKSGRLSCVAPNLQQVPRLDAKRADAFSVRCLQRAPAGYKLVVGDFSMMEMLICGVVCEPKFLQAFKEGRCLHCETGGVILGRTSSPATTTSTRSPSSGTSAVCMEAARRVCGFGRVTRTRSISLMRRRCSSTIASGIITGGWPGIRPRPETGPT